MAFSVNTNVGAQIALQNLNATTRLLEIVQKRVSTGLEVAGFKDSASTFLVAQNQRADLSGLNAVKDSLSRAGSVLDVAITAGEAISDLLLEAREIAAAASDDGLDSDSRVALQNDFAAIIEQIDTVIASAEFSGTNIIKAGPQSINALLGIASDGTTSNLNVSGVDFTTDGANAEKTTGSFVQNNVSFANLVNAATDQELLTALDNGTDDADNVIQSSGGSLVFDFTGLTRTVVGQSSTISTISNIAELNTETLADIGFADALTGNTTTGVVIDAVNGIDLSGVATADIFFDEGLDGTFGDGNERASVVVNGTIFFIEGSFANSAEGIAAFTGAAIAGGADLIAGGTVAGTKATAGELQGAVAADASVTFNSDVDDFITFTLGGAVFNTQAGIVDPATVVGSNFTTSDTAEKDGVNRFFAAGDTVNSLDLTLEADRAKAIAIVDNFLKNVNNALANFGAKARQVELQSEFVSKLSDAIETGIGRLVDADLARESARLQSLQVKQQLGLQALAIANTAPQTILALFR